MSEVRKSLGAGAFALLPIACCIGLPLVLAAGIGGAALVWGGAIVGVLVIAGIVGLFVVRRRARAAVRSRTVAELGSPRQPVSERREEVVRR